MRHLTALIVLLMFIPACGSGQNPAPLQPVKEQAKQTDWTADIVTGETESAWDAPSIVSKVRTATHPQYDRIVLEFSDTVIPGYHIEYVDTPVRTCGSGNPLYLPGDGWLMIRLLPARMHENGTAVIEDRDRSLQYPTLLRLVATCDFENVVTWVAAVSSPNRYRVMELDAPARLVIDILHYKPSQNSSNTP